MGRQRNVSWHDEVSRLPFEEALRADGPGLARTEPAAEHDVIVKMDSAPVLDARERINQKQAPSEPRKVSGDRCPASRSQKTRRLSI